MAFALVFIGAIKAEAAPTTLDEISTLTKPWLLIGTGSPNDSTTPEGTFNKGIGNAVDVSNFELGANKAPVPANEFGNQSPTSYGPGLQWLSNIPTVPGVNIPANPPDPALMDAAGPMGITGKLPTPQAITSDGNVAITHLASPPQPLAGNNGRFNMNNIGLFADLGVHCAGAANPNTSADGCMGHTPPSNNNFFNDINYPNSIGSPTTNVGDPTKILTGDAAAGGTGPNNGIHGNIDFSDLRMGLDTALTLIPGLIGNAPMFCQLEINNSNSFNDVCMGNMLDLTTIAAGEPDAGFALNGEIMGSNVTAPSNLYVKLNDGLNIIDIKTGGNDFKLTNGNIIIDGSADARVIFRVNVPDGKGWQINNGNVLIGNMGIGLNNVMFFSDITGKQDEYNFNNALFNGIAFWTLGDGSGIHVNNSQGCVQMVGDKINLQDVRYTRCGYMGTTVPEPSTWLLFGSGLAGLVIWGKRKNRKD